MENMKIQEIQGNRDSGLLDALTGVWNESVWTSPHFLSEPDIEQLKPYVGMALREVGHLVVVYCGLQAKGFMGIQGDKVEMLFLSPECTGQEWGSIWVDRAIGSYGATKVDVNEQNDQATHFYLHKGFRTMSRDALDEQGNPFPILHLTR